MGASDPVRPRLAQPEITHLALFDEPRHRADGLFDRHGGIDPVLVVEVDGVDAEPLQARLAGLRDVGRGAVDTVGAARAPRLAELAGNNDAVTPVLQRPAEQLLVLAPAIPVRAVEMVDTEFDRAVDQRDPR